MKLLFLTSRLPFPPFQGDRLKIYHILRILSRKHDITLLTFVESEEEAKLAKNLQPFCSQIEVVVHPRAKIYKNLLFNLFRPYPFQVAYYQSEEFSLKLNKLLAENHFDAIHTHLIRMVPYTSNLAIPRVLDLTDAISKYLKARYDSTSNLIMKALLYLEWQRMLKYEPILHRFNVVSVCSEADRDALLQSAPRSKTSIIRNGLDLEYFQYDPNREIEPYSLIFTGNMAYPPNEDGVIYFCDKVLPLILQRIPQVKLYIVGKSPSEKVQALASESIVVTGKVSDMRDYYSRAQISVCPIRFGAGTLNKVIEPMAMGIPVISTSIACMGMNVTPMTSASKNNSISDANIVFADTPEDFASAVLLLLTDNLLCERLGAAGKKLVDQEHDWEEIVAKLDRVYTEIVDSTVTHDSTATQLQSSVKHAASS